MKKDYRELNSCICKCGNISCRKINVHAFSNQISKDDNQFIYSVLHHNSLGVLNSKSIVIDKCCENVLHFHCFKCHDEFSIVKSQSSKYRFIFGFDSDCLTHLEPIKLKEKVKIPDFPISLKSFVYLNEQKKKENDINKSSHLLNYSFINFENDEDDRIFSFDSDENIMFGKDQTNFVIGKYNESSISSFKKKSQILNENEESDEIFTFDSDEHIMFGKEQTNFVIGKLNEVSISSFGQSYSTF